MQLWRNDLARLPDYVLIEQANIEKYRIIVGTDEVAWDGQLKIIKAIDEELEARWQYIKEQLESYEQEYQ